MGFDVFVSYRRDDASSEAGRLADDVRRHLGNHSVFLDTSDIRFGEEWPAALRGALESASVVIAVMGPEWILARDEYGRRRIDAREDWVRTEIQTALDARKTVIPLLVRHARKLPREALPPEIASLSDRQAFEIRVDNWSHDVENLLGQLDRQLGRTGAHTPVADLPADRPTADDFRAVALGFDSRDRRVRNSTVEKITRIAASLELEDVLGLCRSRKTAEQVGAAIALGVHIRSSGEARRDRRVLSALGELLSNRSSFVRYRAAEVVRLSPALVPTFEDELVRLAEADDNPYVRRKAADAVRAAGR